MNYKIIIPAIAVTLGLGLATTNIFAEEVDTSSNPMESLVQKLVDRFGLNQDEVQAVFEEVHQERHEQRQAEYQERLTQLVDEGKITQEQMQIIVDKHQQMMSEYQFGFGNNSGLSREERQEQMQAHHEEMDAWAEENGIDLQYLMPMGRGGGHRGFGGPEFGQNLDISES